MKKFEFGVGRPPIYSSVEELQAKITEYFESGFEQVERQVRGEKGAWETIIVPKITITGLVLYLGFADRRSFYDYEEKPDFSYTIKRARSFIEKEYEQQLDLNPTGAIFALKNFGWTDKQEFEHSGGIDTSNDSIADIAATLKTLIKDDKTTDSSQNS